eukprot:GDKK01063104.1.p1 GENE.GDKK01063104.1~~GDKK01063104.1.p1  ORF type:complete len:498 (-),score=81.34 GDKK01063104.1:118-1422(-)
MDASCGAFPQRPSWEERVDARCAPPHLELPQESNQRKTNLTVSNETAARQSVSTAPPLRVPLSPLHQSFISLPSSEVPIPLGDGAVSVSPFQVPPPPHLVALPPPLIMPDDSLFSSLSSSSHMQSPLAAHDLHLGNRSHRQNEKLVRPTNYHDMNREPFLKEDHHLQSGAVLNKFESDLAILLKKLDCISPRSQPFSVTRTDDHSVVCGDALHLQPATSESLSFRSLSMTGVPLLAEPTDHHASRELSFGLRENFFYDRFKPQEIQKRKSFSCSTQGLLDGGVLHKAPVATTSFASSTEGVLMSITGDMSIFDSPRVFQVETRDSGDARFRRRSLSSNSENLKQKQLSYPNQIFDLKAHPRQLEMVCVMGGSTTEHQRLYALESVARDNACSSKLFSGDRLHEQFNGSTSSHRQQDEFSYTDTSGDLISNANHL